MPVNDLVKTVFDICQTWTRAQYNMSMHKIEIKIKCKNKN